MDRYIGLLGIAAILGIALLISTNRKAIKLRIVGAAFALQALVAVFVIYSNLGRRIIESMAVFLRTGDWILSTNSAPRKASIF